MPTVPVEQNHVGLAEVSGAKFRAPDMGGTGGEALGRGLQQVGAGLGEYAVAQDQIQDHADKIYARNLAIDFQAEAGKRLTEYKGLQGKAATDQSASVQSGIGDLAKTTLDRAGNARQRAYLEELIKPQTAEFSNSIAGHAQRELFETSKATYSSGIALAQQSAAQFVDDPKQYAAAINQGRDYLAKLGALEQWDENTAQVKALEFTTGVHAGVINGMLAKPDADLDAVQGYFDKHKGEMSIAAQNKVLEALQEPLQRRDDLAGFMEVASGAKPSAAIPEGTYKAPVEGRISNTYEQHLARGSHGLDIAAAIGSAVHPIAGGKVLEVSEDARSGKFVRVQHPDGHVSSYSHLGAQSVKKGDVIDAGTVLGTVGMTGHTEGPHVHLRVKDGSGADVDPAKLLGGKAAGGQVVGLPSAARNWDVGAVLSSIDARTDWTPEKRERVKAIARQRMAQDEAALADQYSDAADQASLFIAQNGGTIPSITALPANVRARMKPSDLAELDVRLKQAAAKAAEIPEDNGDTLTLEIMKRADPQAFAAMNLQGYIGRVAPSRLKGFILDQVETRRKAGEDRAKFDATTGINAAIARADKLKGLSIEDTDYPAVFDTMNARLMQIYDQKKGVVTASDYDQAFNDAMREVRVKQSFLGLPMGTSTIRAFEAQQGTIPAATRSQIVDAYRRSNNGQSPNDDQVLAIYRTMKASGR